MHILALILDAEDALEESNEGNNINFYTISVSDRNKSSEDTHTDGRSTKEKASWPYAFISAMVFLIAAAAIASYFVLKLKAGK